MSNGWLDERSIDTIPKDNKSVLRGVLEILTAEVTPPSFQVVPCVQCVGHIRR